MRRNWIGALTAALAAIFAVVVVEGASWLLMRLRAEPWPTTTFEGELHRPDPLLGYRPRAGTAARTRQAIGEDVIYDVGYRVDDLARRQTPRPASAPAPREFALFFGGSFAFGEGVEDDETLPFFFGEARPAVRPYNYACGGWGPNHALALIEQGELREQVEEADGVGVYTFLDQHVQRAVGSMYIVVRFGSQAPYFAPGPDGALRLESNFRTGRPWTTLLYRALNKSHFLAAQRIDFPRLRQEHWDRTCRMLAQAAEGFRSQLDSDRFYVLLYPGATEARKRLQPCLEGAGVRVLDYARLFDPLAPENVLSPKFDHHPTPAAYRTLAQRLALDLRADAPGR